MENTRSHTNSLERWSVTDAVELYGIRYWGAPYFDISTDGQVEIKPYGADGPALRLLDIISGIKERGLSMPILLRLGDILHARITRLHESFARAICEAGYQNCYRGVYPIKVNQQQQVVSEITDFGARYHHGLEAGSKAELIAAIPFMRDREAYLICNGYKDSEYIDLGLYAQKLGIRCVFVVETPRELPLILERAEAMAVRPNLGVRIKLSVKAGGHWSESGGDHSVFGLNISQIVDAVDELRQRNMLDCLILLHYHLGSQIPNIRHIRDGVHEAARVYSGLVQEGAKMGVLNLGGGLAVDYDGSHTNFPSSSNYTLEEYCADIIEVIMTNLDDAGIAHPVVMTESGRATVAYYSVLLFNILDVSQFETHPLPEHLPEDAHEYVGYLMDTAQNLSTKKAQECFNDALYYRDELRQFFKHGVIDLRMRSLGEQIFWYIMARIAHKIHKLKYIPDDLQGLDAALADVYYGNFSVFQSLPDAWAIDQLFPVMPVHRLNERPTRPAILADITCDCDGKIDKFIDLHDVRQTLTLHELQPDEEYYLGVFLVGAYQETLGDLHNLMGDTNVVSIHVTETGSIDFSHELEGDSVADVLTYVEYDPKEMTSRVRDLAEKAVREGRINPHERRRMMELYGDGLRGYTYFEM